MAKRCGTLYRRKTLLRDDCTLKTLWQQNFEVTNRKYVINLWVKVTTRRYKPTLLLKERKWLHVNKGSRRQCIWSHSIRDGMLQHAWLPTCRVSFPTLSVFLIDDLVTQLHVTFFVLPACSRTARMLQPILPFQCELVVCVLLAQELPDYCCSSADVNFSAGPASVTSQSPVPCKLCIL